MAKTGSHLKVIPFGSKVLGVRLEGNPRRPEPDEFRVMFPGGSVSVCRCTDGTYWAHVAVDHPEGGMFNKGEDEPAHITEARLDIIGKHTSETKVGDFENPGLTHLAVRVTLDKIQEEFFRMSESNGITGSAGRPKGANHDGDRVKRK